MKNKIVLIVIGVLIVLAAGAGMVIYVIKNIPSDNPKQEAAKTEEKSAFVKTTADEKENQPSQDNTVKANDFSLQAPSGWQQVTPPNGVSALLVNNGEEIIDEGAKKINFRSYFSVGYDTFKERSQEEYVKYIKDSLAQALPGIAFVDERSNTINGKDAYFIEAELNQKDTDFKVLIVLIQGGKDDVWTISFNTTKNYWPNYKDLFYRVAESFTTK